MKKSLLLVALVTVFATSFGTTSADASSKESSIGTLAACVEEERSFPSGVQPPHIVKVGKVYLEMFRITNYPDGSSTVLYRSADCR
ncbi:hypothetical protein [Brevibacillus laterosporus]|uniref:hypothetical protein n=1 Tax=Brevibacillus laterosporus TaxID=1465 RepID=UPI00264C63BB|nr:hypothetical protein [Brevibacillus laterosporus]MDN9011204.1 hypothetical protein [Brevibacillus laterosporus]MDO0942227.1 hypothetical protein [Brevibacillus laterosporus]